MFQRRDQHESEASLQDGLAELRARIMGRLKLGLYARIRRYGLCRDLNLPLEKPNAKIPIEVRPLQEYDVPKLLPLLTLSGAERREAAVRRSFIAKGARRGFIAIDERSGTPCYVQWLFGPEDNAFIARMGGFPLLQEDEALLENAYTLPAYRGLGVMSAAMARIADQASVIGARYVLTFVGHDNIASLKGCQRAGFHPIMLHQSVRMVFGTIRRDQFEILRPDDPRRLTVF